MTAPQDAWAGPLASKLVNRFRSTALSYVRVHQGQYDPEIGLVSTSETVIPSAGAPVKSFQGEKEGVQQGHSVTAWIDHVTVPWPLSTNDFLEYLGKRWKIISIGPTYGSGGRMYASKVTARAE
jgi:hypothetical protein